MSWRVKKAIDDQCVLENKELTVARSKTFR